MRPHRVATIAGASAGAALASFGAMAFGKRAARSMAPMVERDGYAIPKSEQAFCERLHRANQLDIEASELAKERGIHARVRELGAYLMGEHEKADYELQLTCQRLGLRLGKPVPMGATELAVVASQTANAEKLKRLHGLAFDHAYASIMLGDHDHAIGVLRLGADIFSAGHVGALCKAQLPALFVHRQKLLELCGLIAPSLEVPSISAEGAPQITN